MFVISRTFVAIKILRCLAARQDGLVSSTEIANNTSIPRPYVRKVANQLIRAGIIRSVRGFDGGLVLARPASEIRLGEVLNTVEEKRAGRGAFRSADPMFSDFLENARSKFLEVLNEHSIADLYTEPMGSRGTRQQGSGVSAVISASGKGDASMVYRKN